MRKRQRLADIRRHHITLSDRELWMVIAALRFLEDPDGCEDFIIEMIATNNGAFGSLDRRKIDGLCQRLKDAATKEAVNA